MTQPCNIVTTTTTTNPLCFLSRPTSYSPRSYSLNFTTMMTNNNNNEEQDHLNALFKQKQLLRSRVRKDLKNMDPTLRSQEGLAFDRSGRRLGRGGGYYDTFLKNYQELAKARDWKQPLLVALSYSLQILDEGVIPVTANDVPVDALVSSAGVIPSAQML